MPPRQKRTPRSKPNPRRVAGRRRCRGALKKNHELHKLYGYEVFQVTKDPHTQKIRIYTALDNPLWELVRKEICSYWPDRPIELIPFKKAEEMFKPEDNDTEDENDIKEDIESQIYFEMQQVNGNIQPSIAPNEISHGIDENEMQHTKNRISQPNENASDELSDRQAENSIEQPRKVEGHEMQHFNSKVEARLSQPNENASTEPGHESEEGLAERLRRVEEIISQLRGSIPQTV